MIKKRYLTSSILKDLSEKMVFVGGPRQVGKTTLARELVAKNFERTGYFNWDNQSQRKQIIKSQWPGDADLIILDEIHKYKNWKSFLKGEFDVLKDRYNFLITGSARLDIYRKSGDSMMGRYHYYRLHPFTVAEALSNRCTVAVFDEIPISPDNNQEVIDSLDIFGGFPEPFIKQNKRTLRRWHNEKNARLFREDIRDVNMIRDLSTIQLLGDLLPERAASLLSINAIREDLSVSHRAVSSWLAILESFYYCFRVYPFSGKNYRSLKKEAKIYLWDWSEIVDDSARFENMVASHLLKFIHYINDWEGHKAEVRFLRSIEKKEVDFLISINNKPWFAVEVKLTDKNVSPNLAYFKSKIDIPYLYQIIKPSGVDSFDGSVRVVSADRFLGAFV